MHLVLPLLLALSQPAAVTPGFDAEHIKLELAFDETKRSIAGRATETVRSLRDGLAEIDLDADEMRIIGVHDADGRPVSFEARPPILRIRLDRPLTTGKETTVSIDYEAAPRRGVYFFGPDARRPKLPHQVWSQNWPEDARYWFPCHDDPADKVTSEVVLTTPSGYEAVSNGDLVDAHVVSGRKIWHWRLDQPHSTYLISFVTGEYEAVRDESVSHGVPLTYYVYKGQAGDARKTFGRTSEMLRFFSDLTGMPFPYSRYSQAIVGDFPYGGMENITAATLPDSAVLDERARLDTSSEPVIAHELAHQWWGDTVTPRRWSDLWLSEGFATFFEHQWQEHSLGADAASYQRLLDRDAVATVAIGARQRPVVFGDAADPTELLTANSYQKGSLVLSLLRRTVGDEPFWRGVHDYLHRFAFGSVETEDFRRSLEEAAGRDLHWFFEEWLLRPGLPRLHVSHRWNANEKRLVLTLRQEPAVEGAMFPFQLPLEARVFTADGAHTASLFLDRAEREFVVPCSTSPLSVTVDPDAWFPMTVEAVRTPEELAYALAHGLSPAERSAAARALGGLPAAVVANPLSDSLARDPFWGVRAEAAIALGLLGGDGVFTPLERGSRDPDPRVRAAAFLALSRVPRSRAEPVLVAAIDRDPSELAAAAALRALGAIRSPRAFDVLSRALLRDSHAEQIRISALVGLASLQDSRALPLALAQASDGRPSIVRAAAILALRDLGRGQRVAGTRLVALLEDRDPKVRQAAAGALGALGDPRSRGHLREALGMEPIPAVRREMDKAIRRIEGEPAR